MADDIYANAEMSKKVRYNSNVQEDRGEWEEREVEIYESTDAVRDDHADDQSHGAGPDAERRPPAVQRKTFRAAAVGLAVLCSLMMTGIILLSVYCTLLQTRYDQLSNNNRNLQISYETLSVNHTQLEKQLKNRTEVTLLQTRYDQLSNNYTQLQDEVKQLKDRTEVLKIIKCPDGWTRSGPSWYFKSKEKKNWDDSRADCKKRGADLVVIDNEEEQKFVSELSNGGESWIGLWSGWTQGGWSWVDGSPLRETFWGPGLPQSGYYAACCDQQGKWTQSYYYDYKTWICEKKMI